MRKFRKLGLALTSVIFLVVSLVFSTYAFVVVNKEVDVEEFNYKIQSDIGLWASLDGKNYSQDITSSEIISAINSNLKTDDGSTTTLDNFVMKGITPKTLDNSSKLDISSDGIISFKKDKVVDISTTEYVVTKDTKLDSHKTYYYMTETTNDDGTTTKTYSQINSIENLETYTKYKSETLVDGKGQSSNLTYYELSTTEGYSHSYVDVSKSEYISFDIYFKIINVGSIDTTKSYSLSFTNRTNITGSDVTFTPVNDLTTLVYDTSSSSYISKTIGPLGTTADEKTVTINPSDAMRLAVVNVDDIDTSSDTTSGLFIFEKSGGLGSAAIESSTISSSLDETLKTTLSDNRHNKEYNAMYTYYNKTYPLYPFTSAATYNESFNTYDLNSVTNSLENTSTTTLGTFTYTDADYNTIHLKISIYLEGWDADYLSGIAPQSLNVTLGFQITEI